MSKEKAEELRVVIRNVGYYLLGVRECLETEIGYNINADESTENGMPAMWRDEELNLRIPVLDIVP